jgi:hypothetical protein
MRIPRCQEMRPSTGAYVAFYCESCNASINSSPDVGGAIGNQIKNSLLREIPIIGGFLAGTAQGIDRNAHWAQVQDQFTDCAQCSKVVCRGCYDGSQKKCSRCSGNAMAGQAGQVAAAAVAGLGAIAAGLGGMAAMAFIECPSCKGKTPRAPNCTQCGKPIPGMQRGGARCANCSTPLMPGAKFCAKCGGAAA